MPEIYEALEERGVNYAIRIPANENLDGTSPSCVTVAPGGEAQRQTLGRVQEFFSIRQRPGIRLAEWWPKWSITRASSSRGFIVTNLSLPSRAVVRFYNNRFRPNEVRLWFGAAVNDNNSRAAAPWALRPSTSRRRCSRI